eukprot:COSAG03_NODE_17009_length_386_cov_0.898955_1_plen_24_part_10
MIRIARPTTVTRVVHSKRVDGVGH